MLIYFNYVERRKIASLLCVGGAFKRVEKSYMLVSPYIQDDSGRCLLMIDMHYVHEFIS